MISTLSILVVIASTSVTAGDLPSSPIDDLSPIVRAADVILSGRVSGRSPHLVVSPIRTFKGASRRLVNISADVSGRGVSSGDTRIFFFDGSDRLIHKPLRPSLRILNIVDALVKDDTGYSSLALNRNYEVSGGAALHQITDDGRTRAPRVRGLVPIFVIAGASVIFTAASALLLYYNYVAYKPQEIIIQDPCEMTHCPQGAQCRVHDGLPVCSCIATCSQSPAQVCGTDGQTYLNLCFLRRSACINNTKTGVQHPGPCADLAGWYNPPSVSEEDRAKIVAYVHRQERIPKLEKEIGSVKRRMEAIASLNVKDSHDIEREAKLKAIYEVKNSEWKDLISTTDPAKSLSAPAKATLSGFVPTMPLISWMMVLSNIGMGYASYVILSAIEEEEESLLPMFAYASQLVLSWTVYPMLFGASSFSFSVAHLGLTAMAALSTASMFYAVDESAGYMMIPQVLVMGCASLHLFACGETEFKFRRTLTNLSKKYGRSKREAVEQNPSGLQLEPGL